MLECDDITIELSREQAVASNGNATWTNQIPPLILEEGDTITCKGGWISVSNSGDNSIEVFDQQNPSNDSVDASFKVSYYKTMDTKNVVAFPYHSFSLVEGETDLLGTGFSKPLPIGEYESPTIEDYQSADYTDYQISHYNSVPKLTFDDGETYSINITESSSLSNLIHTKDSDKYEEGEDYLLFLTNADMKQGHRDLCNTGNYYTALYRKSDGSYDLLQRKVEISIPKGYYSPNNLASYITEQLQTKYFNEQVGDTTETWTNQGRYVVGMTPVAVPNINESLFYGNVNNESKITDFLSLNTSPFEVLDTTDPTDPTMTIGIATGLTTIFQDVSIVDVGFGRAFQRSRDGATFVFFLTYFQIEVTPDSEKDKYDLDYIMTMANEVSGQGTKFQTATNETIYQNIQRYDGDNNGFRLNIAFMIPSITYNTGDASGLNGGTATNQALWGGYISQNDNYPYQNPFYINPLQKAVEYVDPTAEKPYGSYKIIVTGENYYPTSYGLPNNSQYIIFPTSMDSLFLGNTWLTNEQVTSFKTDYPDGYALNSDVVISVGGNIKIASDFSVGSKLYSNRLPLGVPIYSGLPKLYTKLRDPDFFVSTIVNNNSIYSWMPVFSKARIDGGYQPDPKLPNFNEAVTLPYPSLDVKNASTRDVTTGIDYKNGNKYLGQTSTNWNRWTLKNWEEPPKVESDDPSTETDVMPILRKYPLFMSYGMLTNLPPAYLNSKGIIVYKDDYDATFPDMIDPTITTISFNTADQTGNVIFTSSNMNKVGNNGLTMVENWYNFIQAQIDDGLIDIELGTHTYDGEEYFYAYTHFCMTDTLDTIDDDPILSTNGSDEALRNRPRGLIVRIHKNTFVNKLNLQSVKTTARFFNQGFLISNEFKIGCPVVSWIYDKIQTIEGTRDTNFGFQDYNVVTEGTSTIDFSLSIMNLYDAGIRFGWGYSYRKMGWRNYTSMLVSYSLEESDATSMMFNSDGNRMDKNASKYNPNNVDATEWGSITYNPRVYLGADSASLQFDTDGSSRFYFTDMFITNKISSKYFEGTSNNDGGALQPSVQKPFYNPYGAVTSGISETPQVGSDDTTSVPPTFSEDLPANSNAGLEIIQYNKTKRDLYNDALFQLAPEITKHIPVITTIQPTFLPYNSSTTSIENAEQGNYITGNWFGAMYPTDTDFSTRFFCFDQDCRHHTFNVNTYTYDHTINLDTSSPALYGLPDGDGVVTNEWTNYEGSYLPTSTTLGSKYFAPTNFWGSFPTDQGFIERTSEAGTSRPDKSVIYDTLGGIQVYNWGQYGRDNWTDSFWDMIGFKLTDLMPTPFPYCSQQRNFTTNFMTESTELFRTHSYPMRQDADLTSSGFVSVNSNIQGYLQYTIQYPRKDIISSVGLQGINNLEQNCYVLVAGTSQPSLNSFPYQFGAYTAVDLNPAGASLLNGQLVNNDFAIAFTSSTKNYASDVADKLQSPFYLIRSDLPDDNYKYTNNAEVPSIMPILAVISKQYGATGDWYYSGDSVNMEFVNKRRRVLTEIRLSITEKSGKVANTIQPKSTIFVKINRAGVRQRENKDGTFNNDIVETEDIERTLDDKQLKLYEEEIEDLLMGSSFP